MFADFIIKNAAPIIAQKIQDIIENVAKKYNLPALELDTMMKYECDNLVIYVFYQNKKVDKFPLSDINITGAIVDHIKGMFENQAIFSKVHTIFVSYVFKIFQGQGIRVNPCIQGEYQGWRTLKEIL